MKIMKERDLPAGALELICEISKNGPVGDCSDEYRLAKELGYTEDGYRAIVRFRDGLRSTDRWFFSIFHRHVDYAILIQCDNIKSDYDYEILEEIGIIEDENEEEENED